MYKEIIVGLFFFSQNQTERESLTRSMEFIYKDDPKKGAEGLSDPKMSHLGGQLISFT